MRRTVHTTMPIDYQHSTGVALIMAILITSLVSIAAVAMVTQQQLDIRRTQNILHFDQAYMYVLGAEEWAKGFLSKDSSLNHDFYPVNENNLDVIGLPIAEQVKQSGIDIGGISGIITDASAGFPLNNIVDANGVKDDGYLGVFEQLVAANLQFNPQFHHLVLDWLDKDENVGAGGAEDTDYLNLAAPNRPYRAANQPITSVSELRLMLAMSEDAENAKNDYAALARPAFNPLNAVSLDDIEKQPLVNALPQGTKININTAPKAVLKALLAYMEIEDVDQAVDDFVEKRKQQPQENTNEFLKPAQDYVQELQRQGQGAGAPGGAPAANNSNLAAANQRLQRLQNMVDVKSQYFYLTAQAQIGDTVVTLLSLLYRENGKVKTLRRGIGVI